MIALTAVVVAVVTGVQIGGAQVIAHDGQSPISPAVEAAAPPVEELVTAALERAPALAALRERLAAAREMVRPAGALPDPMAELMPTDIGFPKWTVGDEGMSMLGLEVRQNLLYPGKRAASRGAAIAVADVRAAELEALRREVAAEVRTLYAKVYALDKEREALDAARELLDMLSETVASRYSVGEAEQEAVIKAQLEISRLGERLDDLAAERETLVASLNRLLDQPGGAPLGKVQSLPPLAVPQGDWAELIQAAAPAVAVRWAEVAAAEKRIEVAKLELKPNLTAGAAYGYRGGLDPAVTLRFGVEWPLWRREKQQPMIRAAERELAMAQAELADAQALARAEAARLRSSWERSERQVRRYREAIIPQTSAAIDAARASYLSGRGDFSTVVEDFDRWLDARAQLAKREAERMITWAEIESLTSPAAAAKEQQGEQGEQEKQGHQGEKR